MQHVSLGKAGLKVSRICLGCMSYGSSSWRPWILDETSSRPFFKKALDLGVNFFDTADIYSDGASEEVTGRHLLSLAARHEVVIATKVFNPMGRGPNDAGLSRKHIMQAIDASLRRLGTDHVDLYQIHRFDPATPVEETMEALHDVVKAGKALYIGASSMRATQFARMQYTADRHGWTRFVTMQNHYNLVYREEEHDMNPYCVEEGVGLIPWSPLARGFLAGNRKPTGGGETVRAGNDAFADRLYFQPSDFDVAERTAEVARERGLKSVQVALAWLLQRPGVVSPIIGATKLEYLDDAVAALDVTLSAEEIRRLEEPYVPHAPHLGT
jgi:aryl-alcohol dehydrogenase-like predicted oxidoreductase